MLNIIEMDKEGPIIIVDDDADEHFIFEECFRELGIPNKLVFFSHAEQAFEYLLRSPADQFLILADSEMPRVSGIQLFHLIKNNFLLAGRCIPFILFSTGVPDSVIDTANMECRQGFFIKPNEMRQLTRILRVIVDYWTCSENTPKKVARC